MHKFVGKQIDKILYRKILEKRCSTLYLTPTLSGYHHSSTNCIQHRKNRRSNLWKLRQNDPCLEIFSFLFCGNSRGPLKWEIREGREERIHGIPMDLQKKEKIIGKPTKPVMLCFYCEFSFKKQFKTSKDHPWTTCHNLVEKQNPLRRF